MIKPILGQLQNTWYWSLLLLLMHAMPTVAQVTIVTQPESKTVCEGSSVVFSVVASGTIDGYQWYKNGSPISGANAASYTISSADASDDGSEYEVEVLCLCGSPEMSSAAVLSVDLKPRILVQPLGATKCEGETITLTVNASDAGSFQWLLNGGPISDGDGGGGSLISGATTSSLTISNLCPTCNPGSYSVLVGGLGSCDFIEVESDDAVLVVNSLTEITSGPVLNQTVCENTAIQWTVSVLDATSFVWKKNGEILSSANSATLDLGNVSLSSAGSYTLEASGICNTVTYGPIVLTVNARPSISAQPVNVSVCEGQAQTFSVSANASGGFQWQVNGANLDGAIQSSYSIPFVRAIHGGNYRVIVYGTGACSSETVVSEAANLNVLIPIQVLTQPVSQTICPGSPVDFSVNVSGTVTGFQWFRNDSRIEGATSSRFSFSTNVENANDRYRVEITGPCGVVTSQIAFLTLPIANTPTVTTNKPQGVCDGESAILTALGCQANEAIIWYRDGVFATTGMTLTTSTSATYTAKCELNGCVSPGNSNAIQSTKLSPIRYTVEKENVACFEGTNGRIAISPDGSAGAPFQIQWQNRASTNFDLSNLSADTYTFTLTDRLGCQRTFSESIGQPSRPTAQVVSQDISCFGARNGQILLSATSDNGGLQYFLNTNPPVAFSGNLNLSGQATGSYQIRVIDAKNCEILPATTLEIREPSAINLSVIQSQRPRGASTQDGLIAIRVQGGTAPYASAVWTNTLGAVLPSTLSNDQSSINNIGGGAYQVLVTDQKGCQQTLSTNLIAPFPLLIEAKVDSISCFGRTDGQIVAAVSGGVPISTGQPYQITWRRIDSNGGTVPVAQNVMSIRGLTAGQYEVTVTDSNSIQTRRVFSLVEPAALRTSVQNLVANYCLSTPLGEATVLVNGGRAPYTIQWDKSTEITFAAKKLYAGVNNALVTDASGCTVNTVINIVDSTSRYRVNVTYQEPSCFGRCDGQLNAIVLGGTAPYAYQWSNLMEQSAQLPSVCGGTTTFVEVRDAKGCLVRSTSRELTRPAPRALNLAAEIEVCPSKTFELSAAAVPWGASFQWTLPNGTTKSGSVIVGDTVGMYRITVLDASQCGGTQVIQVVPNRNVTPLFTIASTVPLNKEVIAVDFSTPAPSQIQWVLPAGAELISQDNASAKLRFTRLGEFRITQRITVNDCVYSTSKLVQVQEVLDTGDFRPPVGQTDALDLLILGNPSHQGRIRIEVLNAKSEAFQLTITPLRASRPVWEQHFGSGSTGVIELQIPSGLSESMFIVTATSDTTSVSKKVLMLP